MSPKIAIIISVIIFVVVAGAIGCYILANNCAFMKNCAIETPVSQVKNTQHPTIKKFTPEELVEKMKREYPLVIQGIINISNIGNFTKATVKTNDGKEYTLWPPQLPRIYKSFGVESGQKVQLSGRLNSDGNLEWAGLKPI